MTIPPYLKPGDTIAIIASARKITEAELTPALEIFTSAGYKVVYGKHLFGADHQFSGTDDERAEDLQWALDEPTVKAVVVARGGYGTMRIIDKINFSAFAKQPKWICGYSDITVLHSHIHSLNKIATLHCTMPINFLKNAEATASMMEALSGKLSEYNFEPHPLNRRGSAEGMLVGGNLSLLYALSSSSSDLNTTGKILFLEDLDEYLYHLDRMMVQLKRSGKLRELKGLVVGGMSEMKDNAVPFGKTPEEIIMDAVKEYAYPVCFNFPAGHIDRNLALYLGEKVQLSVEGNTCKLKYPRT